MLFKLIGHGKVFRVVKTYQAAGFIPAVVGVSLCGRFKTTARIADIVSVEEAA